MNNTDMLRQITFLKKLYPDIDEDFLEWLRCNGYFTALASTKYHGDHEGGLFEHSLIVARELVLLTERNQLHWIRDRSPVIIDLFHDICKIDQMTVISPI